MTSRKPGLQVPAWARDAIWYQIFPERFRNGCPASNPTPADAGTQEIRGWSTSRWGMDWYDLAEWERPFGDFYHSVVHRRFGGDLVGVREKLDYLQELGVNALYLNPIFMAPSLHKYDAACLHHIDPVFGPERARDLAAIAAARETEDPSTWIWTAADRFFLDLVAEIHRRGMRVIIDGVFNHAGRNFFAFTELLQKGRASPYRDWYRITRWHQDGSFDYRGWFDFEGLPEFARDEDNLAAPVRKYIFDITRRWMDPDGDGDPRDGVDGWRLDVAFCVPHGFWKEWHAVVKGINPDAFLCGEVVGMAADYLQGDEFDSVMNYMWLYPTMSFFSPGRNPISAGELAARLQAVLDAYPRDVGFVLQNLLDSHDVGRALTMLENPDLPKASWDDYFAASRAQGRTDLVTTRPGPDARQALRQMLLFQMTFLGAPMIYYGTEVGMWGANDPDNRQPMLWDDLEYDPECALPGGGSGPVSQRAPDTEMLAFCRRAMALRHAHAVLRNGGLRWLDTGHGRLLGFVRFDGRTELTVLLNAGDEPLTSRRSRAAADLWEGGRPVCAGEIRIEPRGWRVLAT